MPNKLTTALKPAAACDEYHTAKTPVLLFGCSFATSNRGVSTLAHSVTKLLTERAGDKVVAAFPSKKLGDRDNAIQRFVHLNAAVVTYGWSPFGPIDESAIWAAVLAAAYRLLPFRFVRAGLTEANGLLKAVAGADTVANIWRGDSFSDIYGIQRMLKRSAGSLLALLTRKPVILLPQTYGLYNTRTGRFLARHILSGASKIMARTRSRAWHTALGLSSEVDPALCPDVAFTLFTSIPQKRMHGRRQPKLVVTDGHRLPENPPVTT